MSIGTRTWRGGYNIIRQNSLFFPINIVLKQFDDFFFYLLLHSNSDALINASELLIVYNSNSDALINASELLIDDGFLLICE